MILKGLGSFSGFFLTVLLIFDDLGSFIDALTMRAGGHQSRRWSRKKKKRSRPCPKDDLPPAGGIVFTNVNEGGTSFAQKVLENTKQKSTLYKV